MRLLFGALCSKWIRCAALRCATCPVPDQVEDRLCAGMTDVSAKTPPFRYPLDEIKSELQES
mgnify:CR=1 FL=1